MLPGDDMEVGSGNIRIEVASSSIGACLIFRVQIGRYKCCTGGASVVGIELCRNPKVVQSGKQVGCSTVSPVQGLLDRTYLTVGRSILGS